MEPKKTRSPSVLHIGFTFHPPLHKFRIRNQSTLQEANLKKLVPDHSLTEPKTTITPLTHLERTENFEQILLERCGNVYFTPRIERIRN
jgi:hypothetical protein